MNLRKLLKLENHDLVVSKDINDKICVHYKNGFVLNHPFEVGITGRGDTIEEACSDYYNQISGKKMIFHYLDCDKELTIL